MIPTISQVCSLSSPFEADIADYAAGQCRSVEVWLGKLERYLEHHAIDAVRKLVEKHEVHLAVASYQGGLWQDEVHRRQQAWQLYQRRLLLCQRLGIPTLVVAGDFTVPVSRVGVQQVLEGLTEAAQLAADRGVRIALEFQSGAAYLNNLHTAAAVVDQIGQASLGICLDVFHWYTGPSKMGDLAYLHPGNLFHVQLSDLLGLPRELAKDADRIIPGEGDMPMAEFIAALRTTGYEGCVSMEIMNPQLWQVPTLQFGEIAMTALRRLLGQATP